MAEITKITTHVVDGLDLMLSQFKDKPRIAKFVEVVLEEVQTLENIIWDVMVEWALETAEGAQLDVLGEIVGWPRLGMVDDDYRRLIQIAIQINRHDCQAEATAHIWNQLLEEHPGVRYISHPPAHFALNWISSTSVSAAWLAVIVPLMPLLACLAVSWELVEGEDPAFILDTEDHGLDAGQLGRRVDAA